MKKAIGTIGVILSLLTLSLEIYALPLLRYTEAAGHHTSYANVWRYAMEPPCLLALLLTVGVLVFSLVTFFGSDSK